LNDVGSLGTSRSRSPRATRLALFAVCAVSAACDLGGEVDHDGQYGFFQPAGLPSTGARPLERLLVLEADGAADRTLFYFFEGDLGKAGIGVEDLRGIASRFSHFEMRFGRPPESHSLPDDTATEVERETLELYVDGEPATLWEVSSDELAESGGSRFAPTLGDVRAYFGVRPSAGDFSALELASTRGTLEYTPELAASRSTIERSADELRVDYGRLRRPDYVEVDFFQRLLRETDEAELDGSLWISLWPEWPAIAVNAVLASAFSQGCWVADEPLSVRVTQIARSYTTGETSDAAVVFRRLDTVQVAPDQWATGLELPELLGYCFGFR
jgi:hypothetical protein